MKKVSIFLLILLISNISVTAASLKMCEMSDEYREWINLSASERALFIEPPYCKEFYKETNKKAIKKYTAPSIQAYYEESLKASVNDKYYNAVKEGIVTTPKNQMGTDSCWTFAANSLVETSAMKGGLASLDLSERHIEYSLSRNAFTDGVKNNTYNRSLGDGGNATMSSSYYASHEGPILESAMPFENNQNRIPLSGVANKKTILDIDTYINEYYVAGACSSTQITNMKNKILKYGSVGVSFYYDSDYLNNDKYYYFDESAGTNHAVVVVGWDDTVDKSQFKKTPSRNGAWIVKNSWGTNWGDGGYFYVSYDDFKICANQYNFNDVKVNTYNNTYASSETLSNFIADSPTVDFYAETQFIKKSGGLEYLDKVSVQAFAGSTFSVYISTSNYQDKNTWKLLGTSQASEDGVYSVKFSPISITGNYSIIVKYTGSKLSVPLTCKTNYETDLHYYIPIVSGVNNYSFDTYDWYDYAELSSNVYMGCKPVIYAYTRLSTTQNPTFSIKNITSSAPKVYTQSSDYYTVNLTSSNIISYELFSIKIKNASGIVVNNLFNIENNIANGVIKIRPNAKTLAGTYTLDISYGNILKTATLNFYSLIESTKYTISGKDIIIRLAGATDLPKATFFSNINTFSNPYKITNSLNEDVTGTISYIGTGTNLIINGEEFNIFLIGDVSGDGKIRSNDALLINRHLVYLQTLDEDAIRVADISGDNQIKSNDALLISRYVVGLKPSF